MERLNQWLQKLSQQQRIIFLIAFLGVVYFIWSSAWADGYDKTQADLNAQIKTTNAKLDAIQQVRQQIKTTENAPETIALKKQIQLLNQQLKDISKQLVSSKQMIGQLRGMFSNGSEVNLVSLQNLGSTQVKSQSNDKAALPLYQHAFVISFEGNYFSTLQYLEQLQKLPGQLYFDSIEYTVTKYPNAIVTIKAHTLSTDASLIDA